MKNILLSVVLTAPVFAYQLDSITVESGYGTKTSQKLITSPSEVITEKEIEERRPLDFKEIIFNRDGFSYTSNGGFGQTTSVYLWGTAPKRTVFYVDGIRFNDFTNPNISAPYELIMMENIQQVEIIKGVQSGVWGADAVGGVINMITKVPEEGFHITLSGMAGYYNTKKTGITVSFANEKIYMLLGYHHFKTSGFSAAEPVKSSPDYGKRWDEIGWERDPYRNETVSFKMGWIITENDRFETVVKNIDAVIHYDAAAGVDARDYDNPFGYGMSEYFNHYSAQLYKLQYDRKSGSHNIRVLTTKSTFTRTQYGGYKGEYREFTVSDKYTYGKGFVRFGFSRQDFIHYTSGGTALDKRYHSNGYFLTNVLKVQKFVLSQSLRHDSYSAFKDKTTWKLGGKYYLEKDTFFSANWGTGYNVPTNDQLYNPWWGNSNLKPESSSQWDVGVGFKGFNLTYFHYSIKNLIDYNFFTYRYENISGKTKIKGIDASYSRFIRPVFIKLGYTYLDTRKSDGKKLPRRPMNQIGFDVVWYPSERASIGISGVYVGKRKDTTGAQTGYYTVINSYINLNITKNLTAYVKINNITDKYYQTVDGYATQARSIYAGADVRW